MVTLSAGNRAKQQALSNKYGIVTFTPSGAISTTPQSGVILQNEGTGGLSQAAFDAALRNRGVTVNLGRSITQTVGSPSVTVVRSSNPQAPIVAAKTTFAPDTGASPVTIFGNEGLSAGNIAKQQALSNKYGIVTFDTKGNISTIPLTQPISQDEGTGKFDKNSFGIITDALNAALFPSTQPPQQPQPPQNQGGSGNDLIDSLKAGLTDIGSQINSFLGSFKMPDSSGTAGNLPADATQQAAQDGGGLGALGGAPSVDSSTSSPVADTSTQPATSFFDKLKQNPAELVIIIIAIVAFIAIIARRR